MHTIIWGVAQVAVREVAELLSPTTHNSPNNGKHLNRRAQFQSKQPVRGRPAPPCATTSSGDGLHHRAARCLSALQAVQRKQHTWPADLHQHTYERSSPGWPRPASQQAPRRRAHGVWQAWLYVSCGCSRAEKGGGTVRGVRGTIPCVCAFAFTLYSPCLAHCTAGLSFLKPAPSAQAQIRCCSRTMPALQHV